MARRRRMTPALGVAMLAGLVTNLTWCGDDGRESPVSDAGTERALAAGPPADVVTAQDAPAPESTPERNASVLEHHNHPSRHGVYTDRRLTRAPARKARLDPTFRAPIPGPVFAQPLYSGRGRARKGDVPRRHRVRDGRALYALKSYAQNGWGLDCPDAAVGGMVAVRIEPGAPPKIRTAWCAEHRGYGAPIVSTTNGADEAVVWAVTAEGTNRLRAFDAASGEVLFDGGGPDDALGFVRRFQTPIGANGRVVVASDEALHAFTLE